MPNEDFRSDLDPETLDSIDRALKEDGAANDVSTLWTVPETSCAQGVLYARQEGVLCGIALFAGTFRRLDPNVVVEVRAEDGARLCSDRVVAVLAGKARSLLSAERVALNLIGRFSGIATLTAEYAAALEGTKTKVCDTRKTIPLWRKWERYAVRMGGGTNHRFNLEDMALLKDNHIALAGGAAQALRAAKAANRKGLVIEIEVDTLNQLEEVLEEGASRVLLDNMSLEQMRQAVAINKGRAVLEASGGVVLERMREIAETGVDLISVGALTHSAKNLDFSLEIAEKSEFSADNP
jgi:nicotinate-nucleotide pyrophosphorylase (carboxylating)